MVAVVCTVADVGKFLVTDDGSGMGSWSVLSAAVLLDLALAAPARWIHAIAVGHSILVAVTPLTGISAVGEVNSAGFVVAGFLAGSWLPTGQALSALGCLVLGMAASELIETDVAVDWRVRAVLTTTSCVLPWLVGRLTIARQTYIAELERRAEQLRRDEEVAVRRAVATERGMIARELHDVISHHVSTIAMHAGAARLGLGLGHSEPRPTVDRSLRAVESAGRAAMVDLRMLLDVLHDDPGSTGRQPGLDALDELLDGVRTAGLPVRFATLGHRPELPGSVELAVFRVAQEALTNALRHGDGDGAEVELRYRRDGVTLSVTNGLPASARRVPDDERAHRGLAGIRQRAGMVGGTIRYGPDSGSRSWRFEADFPVEAV